MRMRIQPRPHCGAFFGPCVVCFAQTTKANQIEDGDGPSVFPSREWHHANHAVILTELAKDAPEFENQLLYVAKKWLTLAILSEQFNAGADARTQLGGEYEAINDSF